MMKMRMPLSPLPVALALLLTCSLPAPVTAEDPAIPSADGLPAVDEEDLSIQTEVDPGGADLGVLVAAPRASINGPHAGVLLAKRPGRRLNVVQGETVRFLSGVGEAVWYRGTGVVESLLAIREIDPAGTASLLGRDATFLRGAAPKISRGPAHVDVTFAAVGSFVIEARVHVAAIPLHGRKVARGGRAGYEVRVWNPGELGAIAGFVGGEADGLALAGLPVVALDAVTLDPVAAASTRCDGTYEIRRIPPGDYLVAIPGRRGFVGEFYDDAPDAVSATPVAVTAGASVPGIDFLLARI